MANRQFPQAGLAPARALHLFTARCIVRARVPSAIWRIGFGEEEKSLGFLPARAGLEAELLAEESKPGVLPGDVAVA